jgi:hypothetical protein
VQCPCPRATTQESRKCQTLWVPRPSRGFTERKLPPGTLIFALSRPASFIQGSAQSIPFLVMKEIGIQGEAGDHMEKMSI